MLLWQPDLEQSAYKFLWRWTLYSSYQNRLLVNNACRAAHPKYRDLSFIPDSANRPWNWPELQVKRMWWFNNPANSSNQVSQEKERMEDPPTNVRDGKVVGNLEPPLNSPAIDVSNIACCLIRLIVWSLLLLLDSSATSVKMSGPIFLWYVWQEGGLFPVYFMFWRLRNSFRT